MTDIETQAVTVLKRLKNAPAHEAMGNFWTDADNTHWR
jgi:hypothetical protein